MLKFKWTITIKQMEHSVGSQLFFSSMGPRIWNGLLQSIINATSMDQFKKVLKTSLFKKPYNCYVMPAVVSVSCLGDKSLSHAK